MLGTLFKNANRMVKTPVVLTAFALTVITLIIASLFALTGRTGLGLWALGMAVLLLNLLVVVLVQRNIMVFMRTAKQTDTRIDDLERLVSRAEWRGGESSRQIEAAVRRTNHSKQLDEIEAAVSSLYRQGQSISSCITDNGAQNGPEERDLEMLLVHAFSQAKRVK